MSLTVLQWKLFVVERQVDWYTGVILDQNCIYVLEAPFGDLSFSKIYQKQCKYVMNIGLNRVRYASFTLFMLK